MWLVERARPRLLVELGTYTGVSYSAFCDAVLYRGLPTRCFAVDTWNGDPHSGFYEEEIFEDFVRFHEVRYKAFSRLLRMSFDSALGQMADASIDLLHIDGHHTYDAVRHDFNHWLPKLSDRAVVLLHDTNVREGDFGVWRLWRELRQMYLGFEFLHASGLGVLAVGSDVPHDVHALCTLESDDAITLVRDRFALLGECWENAARLTIAQGRSRAMEQSRDLLQQEHLAAMELLKNEYETTTDALRLARHALETTRARLNVTQAALERLGTDRQVILNSTIWRATRPLRRVAGLIPTPTRHMLKRTMALVVHSTRAFARTAAMCRQPASQRQSARMNPGTGESTAFYRVAFVSGEPSIPGHIYRITRHAEAFAAIGASVSLWTYQEAGRRAEEVAAADLIFTWRVSSCPEIDTVIAAARKTGAKLLFDVDDLMFEPGLAFGDIIDGIRSQRLLSTDVAEHFQRVRAVLLQADICSCTTEELATRIRALDKPTFVLLNGFDNQTVSASRLAVRMRQAQPQDGIVRIGYAAGTHTHQRDFGPAAVGLAQVLAERPECRLVLFQDLARKERMLDVNEFPALAARADRIEWRDLVPLAKLPWELARFDINLAPVETENPFCEAKSELKFFEAALVDVCTVASPSGPMRRAIRDRETGMLADTAEEWYSAIRMLVDDPRLRLRLGHAAYLEVLHCYGPQRRGDEVLSLLQQISGGPSAASAFELELHRRRASPPGRIDIPESDVVFAADALGQAEVTIIVPLYNYAAYVEEALASARAQTLEPIDLVVVDDASTDNSLDIARAWAEREAPRFNRVLVMRNRANVGLARTRNVGFDAAETPFIVPLDADNRLLPAFCEKTLAALDGTRAAFAYTKIQCFGILDHIIGTEPFSPIRFASGNYIDAMALVAKWAWTAVGGYVHLAYGWEDYDFWCRCVERGFWGVHLSETLAQYRIHDSSMLRTVTDLPRNKLQLIRELNARHPWLSLTYRD